MNQVKPSPRAIFTQILAAVKGNLSVFFGFTVAAFLCCAFAVITDGDIEASVRLATAFPMALLAILIATHHTTKNLTQEKTPDAQPNIKPRLVQVTCGLMGLVIGFVLTLDFFEYEFLAYSGSLCALVAMTVFAFYPSDGDKASENYLANLFKHFLLSVFITGLLFLGLLFLLAAYHFLFHIDTKTFTKLVLLALSFCGCLIFTNFFAQLLFYKRDMPTTKLTKVVFVYMLFPIFALLLLLLYAYFALNLISNGFSNIRVNWFISFASLAFILFFSILQGYTETKAVWLFYKIGAAIIVPLILLQVMAVARRVSAYGLTPMRAASIYYIVFSCLAIALTQVKKARYYRFALVVLGALFVLATIGPLNICSMAYKSQTSRAESVLYKYGLIDGVNSTFSPESLSTFTEEDRERFISAARFLTGYDFRHKKPYYLAALDDVDFLYDESYKVQAVKQVSFTTELREVDLDISNYNIFREVYCYEFEPKTDRLIIDFAGKEYDLTDFALSLEGDLQEPTPPYGYYKLSDYKKLFVQVDDAYFYFDRIDYSYNVEEKTFLSYFVDGYGFK